MTVRAKRRDRWETVGHYESGALFACQQGGLGLFAASRRGIDLITPEPEPTAVAGYAPRLATTPHKAIRIAHPPSAALRPHRIQMRLIYNWAQTGFQWETGNGGPSFIFADGNLGLQSWWFEVSFQWDLGQARMPYLRVSEQRRYLEALAEGELAWIDSDSPPVSRYPSSLHRDTSEGVFAALSSFLRPE